MKKYRLKSAAAALMVAACAIVSPAFAQAPSVATETAALTPRDTGIETRDRLPSVLTARDAELYARIFALQEAGRLDQADRLIADLDDDVLMGHVLFQRYMHPTAYRSSFRELRVWLDLYADHPGAERIHDLAMRRKPADARPPARPAGPEIPSDLLMSDDAEQVNTAALSAPRPKGPNATAILRHQQRVRAMVRSGSVTGALKHLETASVARLFDPVTHDQSLADIARGYYVQNKDAEALRVAAKAANRSGAVVPIAHWWAGLAAWRMQDHDRAAEHFEALARNEQATDWSRAAGGFWAARAYLVGERPQRVNEMLRLASNHPRTFYGLLATRALGLTPGFDWHAGLDTPGPEQELLTRLPGARRALALLQAGERLRAEQELRSFTLVDSAPLTRVILTLADRAGMAEVAFRVGSAMERRLGARFDAAVFPIPAWEPETGFAIDRALVYAFIRQESQFRPDAVSSAGARGLMQLMPATARYVAGRSLSRSDLNDPATNIELGQRYLEKLIKDPVIGGNLFFVAAAYNGGPGNLQKWMRSARYADDPLLFIESIPSQETRIFIERVLTNYWIYRIRMGQATPSLEGVLRGDWPIYSEQDAFAPAESVALQPAAGPGPDPLFAEWPR
jgi:soluble lytic murein transglycosylase-like protein